MYTVPCYYIKIKQFINCDVTNKNAQGNFHTAIAELLHGG